MKSKHFFSLLIAAAWLCGGCVTSTPAVPDPATDQQLATGIATGNAMLEAFRTDNATDFLAQLPENSTAQFGEKEFTASRKNMIDTMGELKSYEFLCCLEMPQPAAVNGKQPLLRPLIWKVRFLRKTVSGRDVYQEMLFRAVIGELDGKPYVLSFGFL